MPGALLAVRAARHELGANPIAESLNELGLLSLATLLLALACTPLQKVFGFTFIARVRRALGLLSFAYVTAHLSVYALLDLRLDFGALGEDIAKRPFITVGFFAWVLLIPLAVTSTDAMVRRLGFQQWKRLHRLAYVCAALGVVHFVWRVKRDVTEPLAYGAVLALLLVARLLRPRAKAPRARADAM